MRLLVLCILLIAIGLITIRGDSFNEKGRLESIDLAQAGIMRAQPLLAARSQNGLVIIAQETIDDMSADIEGDNKNSLRENGKVQLVEDDICVAITGLALDATLIRFHISNSTKSYREMYGCTIPVRRLADDITRIVHRFCMSANSRALATAVVIAGFDDINGCQLYSIEPDGSMRDWNALCYGKIDTPETRAILSKLTNSNEFPLSVNDTITYLKREIMHISDDNSTSDHDSDRSDQIESSHHRFWGVKIITGELGHSGKTQWKVSSLKKASDLNDDQVTNKSDISNQSVKDDSERNFIV